MTRLDWLDEEQPIPIWHARFHEMRILTALSSRLRGFSLWKFVCMAGLFTWLIKLAGLLYLCKLCSNFLEYEHLPKHEVQSQSFITRQYFRQYFIFVVNKNANSRVYLLACRSFFWFRSTWFSEVSMYYVLIIRDFETLIRPAHRHPNLVFQGGADRFGVEVEKWSLELAKNVCVTNP